MNSDLSIRQASRDDIPVIRVITMQVWPSAYGIIIGDRQVAYMIDLFYNPVALQEQMEEQGHRFIICYNREEPIGFASWSQAEPHIFKLHKLYVLTNQQGTGAGRTMIAHIIDEIKKENATALRLNVNIHNSPAIRFYKKAGFTHLKDEDIDIGNGFFMNDHVLELAL